MINDSDTKKTVPLISMASCSQKIWEEWTVLAKSLIALLEGRRMLHVFLIRERPRWWQREARLLSQFASLADCLASFLCPLLRRKAGMIWSKWHRAGLSHGVQAGGTGNHAKWAWYASRCRGSWVLGWSLSSDHLGRHSSLGHGSGNRTSCLGSSF